MKTIVFRIVMLLAVCVSLAGCQTATGVFEALLGGAEKPTAKIESARFTKIGADSLEMEFDVAVENHYAFALPLTELLCELSVGDGSAPPVARAMMDQEGSIPAQGSKTVQVPVEMRYKEALAALQGIRPGKVVPYVARLELGLDSPRGGKMKLPLSHRGELPIPAVPEVSLAGVQWEKLSFTDATGAFRVRIRNTNEFALNLKQLGYRMKLNGVESAVGSIVEPLEIAPGGEGIAVVRLNLSAANLGVTALQALAKGQGTYALDGEVALDSRFGPIQHAFESEGTVSSGK
ncbi:LEA type 2 family protein [Candidatus Poribacteria bacterium]|nr:LEA type 2 family protein [Candidatus Poribacteria bacterium]